MRKTISEHMSDVLKQTGNPSVMWGDCGLLDMCAARCTHTNLMNLHPLKRHNRILTALEISPLFEKRYIQIQFATVGNRDVRSFKLKESTDEST